MKTLKDGSTFLIREANANDVPLILKFIRELAEYEKLSHEVVASAEDLAHYLFGAKPAAEVRIGECNGEAVAFALYFYSFSTFLAKPGIYLEDLYVQPAYRGLGLGKRMLAELARLAVEQGYSRLEWSVLDWNQSAITFYDSLSAQAKSDWLLYRLSGEPLSRLGLSASKG